MNWLRILARVSALTSLALLALMLFGGAERVPVGREWLELGLFPGGVAAGLALAFWRERLGGAITLTCLAAFYLQYLLGSGQLPHGPWFAVVAAPGLLFLIAGPRHERSVAA
jgi:hypothetical protein